MDHIPSLEDDLAESDKLSSTMRPVHEERMTQPPVKPFLDMTTGKWWDSVDEWEGRDTTTLEHTDTSLLSATANDLSSVDVTASGKVDVDGTMAIGVNTILYAALAAFVFIEVVARL